ncbi:MAG: lysylphosphatidylglycerol synthase transmembrane domain-containing protein [bacterium]|jgi:uncharacterized membrane protein YbhN (UPF0104 family)|nr:lysylphosphatidylglycerol synthase transmembrane domain-containing protein [bacterium]
MKSKAIQIIIAVLVGTLCVYFFSKEAKWDEIQSALSSAHYGYILLSIILMFVAMYIRAMRWQIFLGEPKVGVWKLFLICNIGFMGNGIFPARMGELIRPFLIWKQTAHPFPKALTTIVVERFFDLIGLLLLLAFVLYMFPFPAPPAGSDTALLAPVESPAEASYFDDPLTVVKTTAKYCLAMFLLLFVAIGTMAYAPEWSLRVAQRLFRPLPQALSSKLLHIIESFEHGAATFRSASAFGYSMVLTLVLWLLITLSEWMVLWAFGVNLLSFTATLFLMIGICFAVMFPQLPGYIGMYQIAVTSILTLIFYIEKSTADAISIMLWLTQVPAVIVCGFFCMLFLGVSFKEIRQVQRELPTRDEDAASV